MNELALFAGAGGGILGGMLLGWRPRINLLEWIMGWPIGWSALEPLEMARFRQWLLLHGRCSHQTEALSEQG